MDDYGTFVVTCPHCSALCSLSAGFTEPLLTHRRQDGRSWGGGIYGYETGVDAVTGKACRTLPTRDDLECPKCKRALVVAVHVEVLHRYMETMPDPPVLVGARPMVTPPWKGPMFRLIVAGEVPQPQRIEAERAMDRVTGDRPARSVFVLTNSHDVRDWARRRGHVSQFCTAGRGRGPKNGRLLDPAPDVVVVLGEPNPGACKWNPARRDTHHLAHALLKIAPAMGLPLVRWPAARSA